VNRRHFDLGFVPGALAGMFVSTDARTFKEPPDSWTLGKWTDSRSFFEGSPQSLSGDLIREGATGVAGHVAEPYLDATIRPQVLFPAYLSGLNMAESFYSAMPYLSWETVVVGDPLCAPFRTVKVSSGDADPALDAETDLPRFFSNRRLAILTSLGAKPEVVKLLLKGDSALTKGDLASTRRALEQVISIDPALNGVNLLLAGLYEQAGEFPKAAERYRAILATRPDDVRALNNLAYLLAVRQNAAAEALTLAEKAYKMAAGRELVQDLGFALVARRGTPSAALPFSEQTVNMSASHAQIADTFGWTQHLTGRDTEADPLLAEAVSGDPQNAVIQVHVAVVKAALGQNEAAATALGHALELRPALQNDPDVQRLREKLKLVDPK
jgi:Tfp pilus assembly protein PilF